MRARVCAPRPRTLSRAVAATMFAMLLVAAFAPVGDMVRVVVAAAGMLAGGIAMTRRQGRAFRAAEVVCRPGEIELRFEGGPPAVVKARSLRGATTARTKKGILLTLATSVGTTPPITLELESEEDVDEVRRALGIGHGGFGTVSWYGKASGNARAGRSGWQILALLGAIGLATAPLASPVFFGILAGIGLPLALLLLVVGAIPGAAHPTVVMAPDGLRIRTFGGNLAFFPYAAIRGVTEQAGTLWFAVPPPHGAIGAPATEPIADGGLSQDERKILIAQVQAASQRALGHGPSKEDIRGRLESLRRRGEPLVAWLSRLDTVGRALASSAGYRGLDVDHEALWSVLEDPEAEVELRVAAARVLRHTGESAISARVEAALAATHGELETRRLRVAIRDDLDSAGEDLALLEAELALEERHPAFAAAARRQGHR